MTMQQCSPSSQNLKMPWLWTLQIGHLKSYTPYTPCTFQDAKATLLFHLSANCCSKYSGTKRLGEEWAAESHESKQKNISKSSEAAPFSWRVTKNCGSKDMWCTSSLAWSMLTQLRSDGELFRSYASGTKWKWKQFFKVCGIWEIWASDCCSCIRSILQKQSWF